MNASLALNMSTVPLQTLATRAPSQLESLKPPTMICNIATLYHDDDFVSGNILKENISQHLKQSAGVQKPVGAAERRFEGVSKLGVPFLEEPGHRLL